MTWLVVWTVTSADNRLTMMAIVRTLKATSRWLVQTLCLGVAMFSPTLPPKAAKFTVTGMFRQQQRTRWILAVDRLSRPLRSMTLKCGPKLQVILSLLGRKQKAR